jgi:hypothetical protein
MYPVTAIYQSFKFSYLWSRILRDVTKWGVAKLAFFVEIYNPNFYAYFSHTTIGR